MSACPAAEVLGQFVDDTLAEESRNEVEGHVDDCDDCRSTIATLVRAAAAERRSQPTLPERPGFEATEVAPIIREDRSPLAVGTKVGRYVIGETLGVGGMGFVYAARDPDLNRDLAIKVLRPEMSRVDPEATKRITREAQAMARVAHPNVVAVFDVGTIEGQVFIAMERVTGTNLRAWIAAQDRTLAEILEIFTAAGYGLIAAHDAGMVHRDFKPDNVLVGTDGRARVTDFGLADDHSENATAGSDSGSRPIVGTPSYMAPEQHAGANTDARTDQFSFAVALYEAVYQKRPFAGKSHRELADAVINGRIEPPPSNSRVPASLHAIIVRALSVKPGDRYPTLAELLKALGRDRGRRPRQLGLAATVAFALVAVAFGADWIMRDRTRAVTRTSFEAARTQLDKLVALRTEAFVAQSDALYAIPVMQEVVASRDLVDFGLGDPDEDRTRLERIHETLRSADWVGLTRTHAGDVVAIADHKGRLLFDSASPGWGTTITPIPMIEAAYAAGTETYIGVIDAASPKVVASGLLGGIPQRKLYVAFARAKRIGVQARSMFVQLFEAGRLLSDVGVGEDTYLSVVTAEGVAAGTVPVDVVEAPTGPGIEEVVAGGDHWLVERAPLRAKGQHTTIAQLVLARRTDLGLSGLFPNARQVFGVLLLVFASLAAAGFTLAWRRDLTRTRRSK